MPFCETDSRTNYTTQTCITTPIKRWLANYLGGRQSDMSFNGKSSPTRNFPNWVPQGSVLSPTLFNIYMHNTPPTPNNINIMSDDTHNDIPTTTPQLQSYLNTLQTGFDTNWQKVAPTKSTITLLTNYTKEHRHTPQQTLDNTAIPHKHSTKILDTSLSFKDHIHNIKQKCTHRLNTLCTLTRTDFGQHRETLTLIYKQYICSVLEYASPAWAPNLAITHHNTLQTIQNNALGIITGCTQTTLTNHLHYETGTHITRPY